jgi:putative FmdB family regulatory protein
MPMYDYECDGCRHADSEFKHMRNAEPVGVVTPCPRCGETKYRRVISTFHTDLKEFHKPIEMFSIAMEDDETIRDFKRRCPDVDVQIDPEHPDYGLPIARNRKQKLDALRAAGYRELN